MQADLPRIKYSKPKKEGAPKYTQADWDEAAVANEAIYQRYLAAKKGQEVNLTELMQS